MTITAPPTAPSDQDTRPASRPRRSRRPRRSVRTLLVGSAAVLATTMGVVAAPAVTGTSTAQAAECHAAWIGLCGKIRNIGSEPVMIIHGWPETGFRLLFPGELSQKYYRDTDGFWIPTGKKAFICANDGMWTDYCTWVGPGSHKITDNFGEWTVEQVPA